MQANYRIYANDLIKISAFGSVLLGFLGVVSLSDLLRDLCRKFLIGFEHCAKALLALAYALAVIPEP